MGKCSSTNPNPLHKKKKDIKKQKERGVVRCTLSNVQHDPLFTSRTFLVCVTYSGGSWRAGVYLNGVKHLHL